MEWSTKRLHSSSQRAWKRFSVSHTEKSSLLGSQFEIKLCRERYVTPLSYFSQSRYNSLACPTTVLPRLLLDLDTPGGVDPFSFCLYFQRWLWILLLKNEALFFVCSFVKDCFQSVGALLMLLLFQMVLYLLVGKTSVPYQ